MKRWVLFFAVSCIPVVGCYRYTPVATPERGMEVRARLTSEAAVRRSEGRDEPVLRYEGVVVGATPDSLAIDVLIARVSSGVQDVVIRDTVMLPTADLQGIMRRELSVTRTALFSVAAGAAAVAVFMGIDQIVGGVEEPPDDVTPNLRAPLISWQTLRMLLHKR